MDQLQEVAKSGQSAFGDLLDGQRVPKDILVTPEATRNFPTGNRIGQNLPKVTLVDSLVMSCKVSGVITRLPITAGQLSVTFPVNSTHRKHCFQVQ